MDEATTQVKKYYKQPVVGTGCLAEVRHLLDQLKQQDRGAESRIKVLLWPFAWLRYPYRLCMALPRLVRYPLLAVGTVVLSFPAFLLFIGLSPYLVVWLLLLSWAGRRDINNLLLEYCGQFLDLWEGAGRDRDRLKLTVDARGLDYDRNAVPLASLLEDSHPALYQAARCPLFRMEGDGLVIEAFQELRFFHYRKEMEKLPDNFSEANPMEVNNWYCVRLTQNGQTREILGPTQYLNGIPLKGTKLIQVSGTAEPLQFPWEDLKIALHGAPGSTS